MTNVAQVNEGGQGSVIIMPPMTIEEAKSHVEAINSAAQSMGRHLLTLKEREGWRVLGYRNWTAFLQGEFSYSRQYLYELMQAAPVVEKLSTVVDKISTKAAYAIAAYDSDLQPVIARTALARYGSLTESNVNRVGAIIQEMATTGHVDVGNGTSTPVDAALDKEDVEAALRQREYIEEKANKPVKLLDTQAVICEVSDPDEGLGSTYMTIRVLPMESDTANALKDRMVRLALWEVGS